MGIALSSFLNLRPQNLYVMTNLLETVAVFYIGWVWTNYTKTDFLSTLATIPCNNILSIQEAVGL